MFTSRISMFAFMAVRKDDKTKGAVRYCVRLLGDAPRGAAMLRC